VDRLQELSHGAKVVLGAAIVFLIVSFFNWQEVDTPLGSYGISMWHGVGWITGLIAIALIAWQAVRLANINVEIGVTPAMITAFIAVLLFVFTLITFLSHNEFRTWAAWVDLLLSIVIVAGAWWNMQLAGESLGDVRDKMSAMGSGGGTGGSDTGSAPTSSAPPSTSAPADTPEAPPSSDPAEGS
jgi:hypothetical protein